MISNDVMNDELKRELKFEEVIINPHFQKLKKALKMQKPQELTDKIIQFGQKHTNILNFLIRGVSEQNISDDVTQQKIRSMINMFEELYDLLAQHVSERKFLAGIPLLFDFHTYQSVMAYILKENQNFASPLAIYKKYTALKDLTTIMLKLNLFLHNHCCYIQYNKMHTINKVNAIEDCYFGLGGAFLELNQFDDAEHCQIKDKELINVLPLEQALDKLQLLSANYTQRAKLAYKIGDIYLSKEYVLKHNDLIDKIQENNGWFNTEAYKLYLEQMSVANRECKFDQCIFWAKNAKAQLEHSILFFQKYGEGKIKGLPPQMKIDYQDAIKDYRGKVNVVNNFIKLFKSKLFDKKIESLNKISQEYNQHLLDCDGKASNLSIIPDSLNKKSVKIKLSNSDEIHVLIRKLNQHNIICQFNQELCCLTIYNLKVVNLAIFKSILMSWCDHVQQKLTAAIPTATIIPMEPAQTKPILLPVNDQLEITKSGSEPEKQVKRKHLSTQNDSDAPTSAVPKKKIVNWGDSYPNYFRGGDRVFKVRGDIVKRHYLTIKPELLEHISQKNPRAAKTLLNICDRGKALGDSRGNKGVLVVAENAELKDASKDYRFFGQVVATVKSDDGKTRKLIEINSWKETHDNKAPIKP